MISEEKRALITRWIARGFSVIVIGFVLLFLFGEGLQSITVLHIFFPFGVMLGLILSWVLEGIGATLTISSIIVFYLVHYFSEGKLPAGPFFLFTGFPGVFFLLSMFMRKNMKKRIKHLFRKSPVK